MDAYKLMLSIEREALENLNASVSYEGNKERSNYFRGVYEGLLKANQLIKEIDEKEKKEQEEQRERLDHIIKAISSFPNKLEE